MARGFKPARMQSGGVPEIQEFLNDSAASYIAGALVTLASDGELTECGADPATILGVALNAPQKGAGYEVGGPTPVVTTGRVNATAVAIANRAQIFSCRGVNGGTDPVTPTQTHIGESYGVAKDADGHWYLDIAETSNTRAKVVDFDADTKLFLVKFLEANLERP